MAGIYDERILGAKQQAETARKLREGISSPQGQMVSGWYVRPSMTQYIANALKEYGASKQERKAQTEYEDIQKQKEQETADLLSKINPSEVATPSPEQTIEMANRHPMDLSASNALPQSNVSYVQPDERTRMAALLRGANINPEVFQPQLQMAQWEMSQAEKEAARQQAEQLRREQMQQQREMQQERLQAQREMAAQAAADRRALAYGLAGMRNQGQQVDAQGNPIPKLTEAQAKASAFQSQMVGASNALKGLKDYDPSSYTQQIGTGMAGGWGNILTSPTSQQAKQAQDQWSEAFLRFKTGAAATSEEVEKNRRTFFPVAGDSPAVIQQKAMARDQAERDLAFAAGPGAGMGAQPIQVPTGGAKFLGFE